MVHAHLHNTYGGGKNPSVPRASLLDAGELPYTPGCRTPLAAHPASAGSFPQPVGRAAHPGMSPASQQAHRILLTLSVKSLMLAKS